MGDISTHYSTLRDKKIVVAIIYYNSGILSNLEDRVFVANPQFVQLMKLTDNLDEGLAFIRNIQSAQTLETSFGINANYLKSHLLTLKEYVSMTVDPETLNQAIIFSKKYLSQYEQSVDDPGEGIDDDIETRLNRIWVISDSIMSHYIPGPILAYGESANKIITLQEIKMRDRRFYEIPISGLSQSENPIWRISDYHRL